MKLDYVISWYPDLLVDLNTLNQPKGTQPQSITQQRIRWLNHLYPSFSFAQQLSMLSYVKIVTVDYKWITKQTEDSPPLASEQQRHIRKLFAQTPFVDWGTFLSKNNGFIGGFHLEIPTTEFFREVFNNYYSTTTPNVHKLLGFPFHMKGVLSKAELVFRVIHRSVEGKIYSISPMYIQNLDSPMFFLRHQIGGEEDFVRMIRMNGGFKIELDVDQEGNKCVLCWDPLLHILYLSDCTPLEQLGG